MKYLTKEKFNELKQELEDLKLKRNAISNRIHQAKELGDLSENAEYTEAKEAQAFNEGRIQELKQIIRDAVLILKKTKCDSVEVGCSIIVKNKEGKRDFSIVGSEEADPLNGKISNESPLGKAFLGKRKGDEIMVQTPRGKAYYKVLEIK
ncbi:transcription elongation factor GreA [Patescibacteria group bacterium]|nr:transcription elongation factor GreA [Patescibacteria group bacterium]